MAHEPFDRDEALDHAGGDEQILKELVAVFLSDAPSRMERIGEAVARGDASSVHLHAHTLRSSTAALGGWPAADAAGQLEQLAGKGDLAGAEEARRTLEREMERLKAALAELCQ